MIIICASLFQNDVLKSVEKKVAFNVWDNVTYKTNLIKLEVYFEEFNFEKIDETPAYVVSIVFCLTASVGWTAAL